MTWLTQTAVAITVCTAFLYGTAQAYTHADGMKLTQTNLLAHLVLDTETVPHAVSTQPSKLQVTYTVFNPTNQTITYEQRGMPVDWKVLDSKGTVVYDVNKGKLIPHFIAMRILRPNEHQDFPSTISLQDQSGAPLTSGQYTLRACLKGVDNLQTNRTFTIK